MYMYIAILLIFFSFLFLQYGGPSDGGIGRRNRSSEDSNEGAEVCINELETLLSGLS